VLKIVKNPENCPFLDQFPAGDYQDGCKNWTHNAVWNVFAQFTAEEDAGE
jgi:hypothetical protein